MNLKDIIIGFIGSGNMAEALIKGVIKSRLLDTRNLLASDIKGRRRRFICRKYRIGVTASNRKICQCCEVIVLAVKPQDVRSVLEEIAPYLSKGKLLISIVAGLRTKIIQRLCRGVPVIRVMPNTPALIGQGMSAFCRGKAAGKHHCQITRAIFKAVGEVIEVDEKLMDGVTAISGSGPAYFFYLIESLVEAGEKIGFSKDTALMMASRTARGSADLLAQTRLAPDELRRRVTSKGGTTEAALKVLEKGKAKQLFVRAVISARDRSGQLSKSI